MRHRTNLKPEPTGAAGAPKARSSVRPVIPPNNDVWRILFLMGAAVRLISAYVNIVHDCDEVFNYWEPLHQLLYGYGKQTWEYSPLFALRSYFYLLIHMVVAGPIRVIAGEHFGKTAVFYAVRSALGVTQAVCDIYLSKALASAAGMNAAGLCWFLLTTNAGMFFASTALLPSSFTMTALTAATAASLQGHQHVVIATAAVGALLGWPFAALALLPVCLRFSQANLLMYNVGGEGDSQLYGTEGPLFYFRNMANNLNVILPLALLLFAVDLLAALRPPLSPDVPLDQSRVGLYITYSAFPIWLTAMSLAAHKEERFLYVVYPVMCMAAALALSMAPEAAGNIVPKSMRVKVVGGMHHLVGLLLCVYLLLSVARIAALLANYGAPMQILRSLPPADATLEPSDGGLKYVCVGDEWHRFPSAFFLPSPKYRLAFIDSSFGGLLPADFNSTGLGTSGASPFLNGANRKAAEHLHPSAACDFLVEFQRLNQNGRVPEEWNEKESVQSSQVSGVWHIVAKKAFLDASQSPTLTRALYIPVLSGKKNVFGQYLLLQRGS
ncbi:hypothetical protein CYMTET_11972 [Cymbomonas tetramitiformis]|uniref:Mannosyltransferase n=1 Tax=Cymbomonas tetramitiformis TaxID=36881 RepID=A0AAE0GL03_9CHLO|nr:hypothetical protein CYMTET_11972 [Cymbomonas tetramitiformis]